MSDQHHHGDDSNNPLASVVGFIFYVLVPVSLVVMMGIVGAAFLKGGGYVDAPPPPVKKAVAANTGSVSPSTPAGAVAAAVSEEQMALGKTTFMQCAACHGMDGQGMQAGPQKMAPSLTGSELLLGSDEAALAAVLKGIQKEPSSPYLGQMLALGAGLDDQKIAAVLTYARNAFGNTGAAISPEKSAEVRTKYAEITSPMGLPRADLEKLYKK